jgi:hypothetical protein
MVRDEARRVDGQSQHALALARLIREAMPRPHPFVEYRCDYPRRACLLLAVYGSPAGPFAYSPGYTYSPEEAKRQGVAEQRSWPERAYMLSQLLPPMAGVTIQVQCHHCVLLLDMNIVAEDVANGVTNRVRRFLPRDMPTATRMR